jgi:hypothetical protein
MDDQRTNISGRKGITGYLRITLLAFGSVMIGASIEGYLDNSTRRAPVYAVVGVILIAVLCFMPKNK